MLDTLLKRYWGYDRFRPLQLRVIEAVMEGRDTFAMLPTGGGKSLCYQLPALAREGTCLVVSPLIALMQDQVMGLQEKGISAAYLHSGMRQGQVASILEQGTENMYKLLYAAPERFQTDLFLQYAPYLNINLIAVDEAHCISQWGHDFRPAYRKINLLKDVFPDAGILALTASATPEVQEDIIKQLGMRNPSIIRQSVVRSNLFYHVRYTENKPADTVKLFGETAGSGILYCRSRKRSAESASLLQSSGLTAGAYHAGMQKRERDAVQKKWTESNRMIISATTAFGMGIDKPDVRVVVHYDAPESLESYYQEAGRAGRDGADARAVLLFNSSDLHRLRESADTNFPPEKFIRQVYTSVCDYLQLPLGSGKEELRTFDATAFARNFDLDIIRTLSAVRLLEQQGLWIWNEHTATKTSVRFTTNRETLEYLEKHEPALAYVTTNLLRLHGSILHYPTYLNEYEDSRLMRIDKAELDRRLLRLASLGVIEYQPAIEGSTLYFLHNRVRAEHLPLDTARISNLRMAYKRRAEKMVAFLENSSRCRNALLATYFGETTATDCGGCDVCLKRKQSSRGHWKNDMLKLIVEKKRTSLQELTEHFPHIGISAIIEYIRTLTDERLCHSDPRGIITLIKKNDLL